jgi:hypothetical protein
MVKRNRRTRPVGAESADQGLGEPPLIGIILERDSEEDIKDKSGNIYKRGWLWSEKSRAIRFESQVIERIRILIDDLRSDPSKVINHI